MAKSWFGAAIIAAVCGIAHAQDMSFDLVQDGATASRPAPPSDVLRRALDHYDTERFAQAAVMLQQVVEGATEDAEPGRRQAQFFLAKALVHLGFDHAALTLFDEITREGRAHPYFVQSLPWLGRLLQRMPHAGAAIDVAGRFAESDLGQAGSALDAGTRARLQFALGEYAYREGELDRAVARFAAVDKSSSLRLRARFMQGVAHVRARRAQPAIRAFRDVVRLVDAGQTNGAEEAERMRQLAWLSLGRVYYTAAHGVRDDKRQGALIGNAVHAWQQVDEKSEYWLDALFESAWALFVADEHARALGNLHALLSPYFQGAFYPEAHLLQAVIYFISCQMGNTGAALDRYHGRYDPLRDELRALLARAASGEQPIDQVLRGAPGAADAKAPPLSPALRAVLQRVLADRESGRAHDDIARIREQQRALARAPEALRRSTLGERIQQDLAVALSFAKIQADELLRARTQRLLDELQESANQADTIEIEMLNYERGMIGNKPNVPHARGSSVHVDSEHVLWPFNGEYWRDELGYYRQEVSNHCAPR